ncbi:MAG: hypothetical protein GY731_17485 [Gammaproteobacteria bacterium]|nr:hypothetical protein [Gammaproteobacteria bacterium]
MNSSFNPGYVQDVRYAAGAWMRRMYGMPRAHGCAGAAMHRMYGPHPRSIQDAGYTPSLGIMPVLLEKIGL